MRYIQYTIETTTDAEDIVSAVLSDCGIEGIEIEDSMPWTKAELDEIFVDEVPVNKDIPEGAARISFYLPADDDAGILLSNVQYALDDMKSWIDVPCGSLAITSSEIKDEDYLNSWKEYFHALDIGLHGGRTLSIVPSWEESEHGLDSDILLHIDPGTAFGTGAHETTKLCIQALSKYVHTNMSVLDLGTGSGILSMAALKLGAGQVVATDLDENAVSAVNENFEKNGLKDTDFRLIIGDVVSDDSVRRDVGCDYDIVVANILPVVLIPLTKVIGEMVRPGGIIIYSGILIEKAPDVIQALTDNGYEIMEQTDLGEWCAIISKA